MVTELLFLIGLFNNDCEENMKLIDTKLEANIIKSAVSNDEVAYRIVKVDSNADDTIIAPETQEDNPHVVKNNETGVIKNSQQINNILTTIENFSSSLKAFEKQLIKLKII